MRRHVRCYLTLLGLLILIGGCTGDQLFPNERWKLQHLYLASTGTWLHVSVGRYIADQLRLMGATQAGINLRIPSTRLVADVYGEFHGIRGMNLEVYEIKPIGWAYASRFQEAAIQLARYVGPLGQRPEYDMVTPGGTFKAPLPAGVIVPREYTPELYSRCLEVKLTTYDTLSPGVVFYAYRWRTGQQNGNDCRKLTREQINAYLSSYVYDVTATHLPRKAKVDMLLARLGQNYHRDGIAALKAVVLWPEGAEEQELDSKREFEVTRRLMRRQIPFYFKQMSDTPWGLNIRPGQVQECEQRIC